MKVSSWKTPSFLLLPYSLAYNRLSPHMKLTFIPLVSSWWYEVSPTLSMSTPIGSSTFNDSHLNSQPDLTLMPNSASDCLLQAPNLNHYFPPIYITVFTPIPSWYELPTFYEILPVFACTTIFWFLTVRNRQEYVSSFPVHWCRGVIEPDTFRVKSHLSIIPCDQVSLVVYTSFWSLSQYMGCNEGIH